MKEQRDIGGIYCYNRNYKDKYTVTVICVVIPSFSIRDAFQKVIYAENVESPWQPGNVHRNEFVSSEAKKIA